MYSYFENLAASLVLTKDKCQWLNMKFIIDRYVCKKKLAKISICICFESFAICREAPHYCTCTSLCSYIFSRPLESGVVHVYCLHLKIEFCSWGVTNSPLMNSFNKTEAAVFLLLAMLLEVSPFPHINFKHIFNFLQSKVLWFITFTNKLISCML